MLFVLLLKRWPCSQFRCITDAVVFTVYYHHTALNNQTWLAWEAKLIWEQCFVSERMRSDRRLLGPCGDMIRQRDVLLRRRDEEEEQQEVEGQDKNTQWEAQAVGIRDDWYWRTSHMWLLMVGQKESKKAVIMAV